jgi:hypothetical protein
MGIDVKLQNEIDRIAEAYEKIHNEVEALWSTQIVFTWHWWMDVALAVLPWVLWFILRDKKRKHSLFYAGLLSMLAAVLLDKVGVSQGYWRYNTLLLPYFVQYLPWDLTVMPVTVMLFLQYFPKISPWIKGVVFGLTAAYIVEPVFIRLGVYEPSSWEHYYSLPIYFAIYMAAHRLYSQSMRECEKRKNE